MGKVCPASPARNRALTNALALGSLISGPSRHPPVPEVTEGVAVRRFHQPERDAREATSASYSVVSTGVFEMLSVFRLPLAIPAHSKHSVYVISWPMPLSNSLPV
jgi:hypothetical protein